MNLVHTPPEKPSGPPSRDGSVRGIILVLSLLAAGFLALWGLFMAARPQSPPAPAEAVWGTPDRPIRIVAYNILHNQRGINRVVDEIKKLNPDIVFMEEVEAEDVVPMADALGMSRYYHPQAYQKSVNLAGTHSSWGNVILSKFPLYEIQSIPNPGGGSFGVWSVCVIDDKKFMLACVHLSATWNANPVHIKQSGENRWKELSALHDAWLQRGSPPIIIGGDFNQIPMGNNYELMSRDWTDALLTLKKADDTFESGPLIHTRIDFFLASKQWRPIDGGVDRSDASDHFPIWVTTK